MTRSAYRVSVRTAPHIRLSLILALAVISLVGRRGTLRAQEFADAQSDSGQFAPHRELAVSALPDAPGMSSSSSVSASAIPSGGTYLPSSATSAMSGSSQPIAPLFHKYIEPGQAAQPLPTGTKILFGLHQLESPYLLLTVFTAGAYEQAVNGSPNYGTNIGAYGQRVGAAAIRDASQSIFTDSVAAPIFHQDPRYYIMGDRRNALVRASYAVSRVLVTRADDNSTQPNYSLFSGYAAAAALNNAYYPSDNRGFSETAKGFAGSLGGAAISNVVREFLPNILHVTHLER